MLISDLYITFLIVISFLAFPSLSFSQGTYEPKASSPVVSRHNFLVTGTVIKYFNEADVVTEGAKDFMRANNTKGFQLGVGYEYTNQYNITFTSSLSYGMQNHNISWNFDMDKFDPNVNFQGYVIRDGYQRKSHHLNSLFQLGYNQLISRKQGLRLQFKTGIGNLNRLDYKLEKRTYLITYSTPNSIGIYQHAEIDVETGNDDKWFRDLAPYYTFYIGIDKFSTGNFFNGVRLGLTYTHAILKNGDGFNLSRSFYYNTSGERDGLQYYWNKYRSIGVTASIAF